MSESVKIWQLDQIEASTAPIAMPVPRTLQEGLMVGLLEAGAVKARYRHADHELRKGTLILCQPGEVVSFEPVRGERPIRSCLQFPTGALQEVADSVYGGRTGSPTLGPLVTPDGQLVGVVRAFHRTLQTQTSLLESSSRVHTILERIVRVHTRPSAVEARLRSERALVRRIRTYLDENVNENISLAELSRKANVSPYYLNRVFRAEVGLPPHAYQTQLRVQRGKWMLERGMPIHQIATELGFYDQSHFTNQFKRLLGYPPSTYRDRKILQA